ncbi:ABC transporter substrate-binding protein [Paenibacillus oceani]|uniref:Carbohydrate ABC transporter substrate-binding protein n=1 Tax=Paenibacillus oceani TaxID=2772510 RepID=A0A927H0K1_9BACL|nr:ABC transporter substrate-binding protein [Paenibacillus oceani]MBD2864166.1 carbohydrate ABC transporter substrate-binding protein [Paenibacillus oceani]
MDGKKTGFRNKRLVPYLAAGTALLLLAACGGKEKEGDAPGPQQGAASKEPVELTVWQTVLNVPEEQFMQEYGNKIKEKFPEVTLRFLPYAGKGSTISDLLAAGQVPDIVYASIGHVFFGILDPNLQYDMTELIQKNKFDLSRFDPAVIERQRLLAGGGIYGLPTSMDTLVLYYNKDIFDKFGLSYPRNGMTWDETYELARKLNRTEDGVSYRGVGMAMGAMFTVNPLSLQSVDPATGKSRFVSDDGFKKLFDNFARFYHLPGNGVDKQTAALAKQREMFDKEKVTAMFVNTAAFATSTYKDTMNWDVVRLPSFSESPGVGSQPIPTYFYITNPSKKKEKAFEVISYLTSDEFQHYASKKGKYTVLSDPKIRNTFGDDIPYFQGKNVKGMFPVKNALPAPLTKFDSLALASLNAQFDQVIIGPKDVNTALREAAEDADKKIEAEKKKQ